MGKLFVTKITGTVLCVNDTENRPLCSAICQVKKTKGTEKVLKGDGNTAEAIPLYADWIPQANGFAASPVNPQRRESPEGVTKDGQQMTKPNRSFQHLIRAFRSCQAVRQSSFF
jgi:hypothetical protein